MGRAAVARATVSLTPVAGAALLVWWALRAPGRLLTAIMVVGLVTAAMCGVSLVRGEGWTRGSWASLLLASALWSVTLVGAVRGWPGWLTWGLVRGVAYAVVGVGLLVAPGVRRSWRDWGLLLLDGWLVGASAAEIVWVTLRHTGQLAGPSPSLMWPPLVWAAFDVMAAAVVAGLAVRASNTERPGVVMIALAGLMAVAADAAWAITADHRIGVSSWLIMQSFIAAATLAADPDLWSGTAASPDRLPLARWSHVAAIPGLLTAVMDRGTDGVALGLAVSLLVVLGAEILFTSSQLRVLWERAQAQSHRLDTVLRESMDAIVRLAGDGRVEYANPAAAEVYGLPLTDLVGRSLTELVHPDDLAAFRATAAESFSSGDAVRSVARYRRVDGSWRHLESVVSRLPDDGGGYVMVARDVEERNRLETELRRQASTDPLTGLLNRQAFLTALEAELRRGPAAVLFLDLDEFKSVNDTRGHEAGDAILVRVACVIAAAARNGQRVARLGGDEFAVLVPLPDGAAHGSSDGSSDGEAKRLAADLVDRLARECGVGQTGVSIGLAIGAGTPAEELLGNADLAMYEAKGSGGGRYAVFHPEMRRRVLNRSRLRAALERAIADDGLDLDLQPIVELQTGRWAGFEALVRWPDGERQRSPADFLPLAEETGLIVPLGTWVLRSAVAWLATWPDTRTGVSVNVTGRQVAEPGFADLVREALRHSGVAPSRLTLEITEQTAVEDLGRAGEVLQPLRALGVHVALDDFGTGFSSLGYLAQLPVDELKIDRRFVSGLGRRGEDDALVRAVLALAGDFGLQVVAEGVETVEQAAALRRYDCPYAQGYLYARPVPHRVLSSGPDDDTPARVPVQPGVPVQPVTRP